MDALTVLLTEARRSGIRDEIAIDDAVVRLRSRASQLGIDPTEAVQYYHGVAHDAAAKTVASEQAARLQQELLNQPAAIEQSATTSENTEDVSTLWRFKHRIDSDVDMPSKKGRNIPVK